MIEEMKLLQGTVLEEPDIDAALADVAKFQTMAEYNWNAVDIHYIQRPSSSSL